MNRIDRLAAILIQLQSKKWVTSIEIAEQFSICQRTVYRDIKALEEAGVPIGAEAGKGYFLVEGYHLPPVMFSKDEAGALLLGEKLIEKMSDRSVIAPFKAALMKIKAVLPESEKQFVDELNSKVKVVFNTSPPTTEFPNSYIAHIQKALVSRRCLKIGYFANYSKETSSGRVIEPVGLIYYSNQWHLIAFCKLRNELRDFRVDRIKQLEITEQSITQNTENLLKEHFESLRNTVNMLRVSVWFDNQILNTLGEVKYYFGYINETPAENGVILNFAVSEYDYIARWLLSYGNMIKVVAPYELHLCIVGLVKELSDLYITPSI